MNSLLCRIVSKVLAVVCLAAGVHAIAQDVAVYRSSRAGDRLARLPDLEFTAATGAKADFTINESAVQQKMIGFGASFLEAGMICINSLEPAAQEKVFSALFDPEKGAGFTAMKTVIGATDFMSAGPFYTYNDTPGDVEMKHFTIERDVGPNGLVTFINRAKKHGRFVLQAPMDYPPAWMLFDLKNNQDVDPKYYDALALYYVRYLQEYQKQGIFINYLSLFNEPMVYTKIPYSKIRDLLKNHVGPLFHRMNMLTTIQVSDHMDRAGALRELPVILDDPAAMRYVGAISFHGYDFARQPMRPDAKLGYQAEEFRAVTELRKRYRRLPLWMTEVCKWDWGTPWAKPIPRFEFEDGDFWGQQIFSDIEAGVSGWTYWNMILDENGGPWLIAPEHGNPDNNVQHPVVIINRRTKEVTYTGLYYYLAHFSKFVRPYAAHVKTGGTMEDVRCVSFRHDNGRMVSQLMNSSETDQVVTLVWNGKQIELTLPAISITTCAWSNRG